MLSRVADSLYWMGRYLERAEHMARLLEVTRDLLVDLNEVDPEGAAAQWQATVATLAVPDVSVEGHRLQPARTDVARLVHHARA